MIDTVQPFVACTFDFDWLALLSMRVAVYDQIHAQILARERQSTIVLRMLLIVILKYASY